MTGDLRAAQARRGAVAKAGSPALLAQVVTALLVQHLLYTTW